MEVTSVLVTILLSLILLIYWFFKKSFSYWKSMGVPYEKPEIPSGNFNELGKSLSLFAYNDKLYQQFKGKCKIFGIYLFVQPTAVIMDLDLIKTIMVKEFNTFTDRNTLYNEKVQPLTGNVFLVDGDMWRQLRKRLTPTFTSEKIKCMVPMISKVADRFIAVLHNAIKENDEIELRNITTRFTIDVIGTVHFCFVLF